MLAVLVFCYPTATGAVTIADLIALTRAGLPDDILTAVIDADRTVFDLTPEQIIELRDAGLSTTVLRKMVLSRLVNERHGMATTGETDARDQQDEFVVITGVERAERFPAPVVPYVVPFFVPVPVHGTSPQATPPSTGAPVLERPGFGRFINDGSRRFLNDGWVGSGLVPRARSGHPGVWATQGR